MKPPVKRICLILPSLFVGGSENYILRFIKYSHNMFDFTLVIPKGKVGIMEEKFLRQGVRIKLMPNSYYNPIHLLEKFKFLKRGDFDAICSLVGNFGGTYMLLSWIACIKIRLAFYRRSSNAFDETKLKLIYNRIQNRLVYNFATKILSNSEFGFYTFFKNEYTSNSRFKIIRNGFDWKYFINNGDKLAARKSLGLSQDSYIIGHVGRYDKAKNHDTIFKVAQKIINTFDNVFFLFCGDGTESTSFINKLKHHSIENNVYTLGLQDNIPNVLGTLDLFYFPSLTEGQPNALIEAMLSGLPVVTSNIPPIKESIPEIAHNTLLNPTDTESAISVIKNLIINPELKKKYTYQSWAKFTYDHEKNFNLFINELLDGK
jgi:glycosyltransferase involved in cell wall biosynthesis